MKRTVHIVNRKIVSMLAGSLAATLLLWAGANSCFAQTTLPPGIQDVVKLSQARISDEIILSQIKNNQATYNLTADQIILLKSQGVSQPVIKALISGGGSAPAVLAPAVPAVPAVPAPSDAGFLTTSDLQAGLRSSACPARQSRIFPPPGAMP